MPTKKQDLRKRTAVHADSTKLLHRDLKLVTCYRDSFSSQQTLITQQTPIKIYSARRKISSDQNHPPVPLTNFAGPPVTPSRPRKSMSNKRLRGDPKNGSKLLGDICTDWYKDRMPKISDVITQHEIRIQTCKTARTVLNDDGPPPSASSILSAVADRAELPVRCCTGFPKKVVQSIVEVFSQAVADCYVVPGNATCLIKIFCTYLLKQPVRDDIKSELDTLVDELNSFGWDTHNILTSDDFEVVEGMIQKLVKRQEVISALETLSALPSISLAFK